jgi:hypothetical protein
MNFPPRFIVAAHRNARSKLRQLLPLIPTGSFWTRQIALPPPFIDIVPHGVEADSFGSTGKSDGKTSIAGPRGDTPLFRRAFQPATMTDSAPLRHI